MKKQKSSSIISQGLNYKLKIAFYLMAILPLLVMLYLVSNYILPSVGIRIDIIFSIVISAIIAIIGYFLVREVIKHILSISTEAKLIAAGDISRQVEVGYEDEVGDLGVALNQLTSRIRNNMDELNQYSAKTHQINLEIQRRVWVLSNLLQISSMISQGVKLDEILKLIAEKSRFLADSELSYLLIRGEFEETFFVKTCDVEKGTDTGRILNWKIDPGQYLFDLITKTSKPLIKDKENNQEESLKREFSDAFNLSNTLALRIYLKNRVIAVFGIANNRSDFIYTKDDIELLDIFTKQIAIAIENDILVHRVEKLEIKDALTGLYNRNFIANSLQEEIKRANVYQRPCAFILINVDHFQEFRLENGSLSAEAVLRKIAFLISNSVSDIEKVGRFGDNEFAIVLPEKNKRQAVEIAENIRKKIEFSFSEESDPKKRITVRVSVSENPLDGIESRELIAKAELLISNKNPES